MKHGISRAAAMIFLFAAIAILLSSGGVFCAVNMPKVGYDPLRVPPGIAAKHIDLSVNDTERSRQIPLRIYLPASKTPAPVVLFSPGLGGNREGYAYLGEQWSARGYVVVVMQHPGSDDSVWKDAAPTQRMSALRAAASPENFLLRAQDVSSVLDQLTKWNKTKGHALGNRLDLTHIGMAGHSFGAVTTQAVSGESFRRGGTRFTDPRIKAAIALSPSGAPQGVEPKSAFGAVKIPWMLMTGTKDDSPIGNADAASRLTVFPGLPPGNKYDVVLYGAEHSAFSDGALRGTEEKRNPNHHRAILALSTAFWDAYLRQDKAALAWLKGSGPRSILEAKDKWQLK